MSGSMRAGPGRLTVGSVAVILGFLLVLQLRSQNTANGLEALSATELTDVVANLDTRNEQLRNEIAATRVQLEAIEAAQSRGDTSLAELRADLARIRAWAGVDGASGPGVQVMVAGSVPGSVVQDLLNELRNAGGEAFAVGGARVVSGSVAAGPPGGVSIEDTALGDPIEIDAIGNSATLTGSLTRAGGIVARIKATFPGVEITVTPVDRLELPASSRDLTPSHGAPRL